MADRFLDFTLDSNEFLRRARELLAEFDKDQRVELLLYTSLELRMGIECQLYQYIDANLDALKLEKREKDAFRAMKLLNILLKLNPNAKSGRRFVFGTSSGQPVFSMEYTPPTDALAQMHGKLGGYLHFNHFRRNPGWYFRSVEDTPQSMAAVRISLQDIADELAEAARGTLLATPDSAEWFRKRLEAEASGDPA